MLGLPKSTEFNKRIPKQKFYDNLTVSPSLKRSFVDQIRIIYWANKIAPSTVNLAEGKAVTEIEVFLIRLNQDTLDENVQFVSASDGGTNAEGMKATLQLLQDMYADGSISKVSEKRVLFAVYHSPEEKMLLPETLSESMDMNMVLLLEDLAEQDGWT